MSFFDVLSEMLVILFAIVAGIVAKRLGYLGGETDQKLSKLLLNITMPAMILASVITGDELPEASVILSVLEVAAVFYVLSFAVALLVPRFLSGTPAQKGVWRYALSFPNVGFIGYPVAVALFGEGALFYAVVLVLPFNLLSYSLGPLMLAGATRFRWQQLLSPCIVSSVAALVLALTRLQPPALVGEMLDFVGDITVPLSLLVVGSFLADIPAGKVFHSPEAVVPVGPAAVGDADSAVPDSADHGCGGPGAGHCRDPDGHACGGERHPFEHGIRRRHRLYGPDHLPDHPGLYPDHSHHSGTAAVTERHTKGGTVCPERSSCPRETPAGH